jgi:hypothetical protein
MFAFTESRIGNRNMNFSRMKVLIQNPENQLYLEDVGRWCAETERAYDFVNSDSAIQFCVLHGVAPAQMVLHWVGLPHSITIPIAAAQTSHAARTLRSGRQA